MPGYGKFKVGILSLADYTIESPFSNVMKDFEFTIGAVALYDTLTNLAHPWGRHPVTGDPLLVTEVDRYTSQITSHGVNSMSGWATPEKNSLPMATLVEAQVTRTAILQSIHAHADYFILGVFNPDLRGDPLPSSLEPYDAKVPMGTSHKNDLISFCINTLGLPSIPTNTWFTDNPTATPWDFGKAFKVFI